MIYINEYFSFYYREIIPPLQIARIWGRSIKRVLNPNDLDLTRSRLLIGRSSRNILAGMLTVSQMYTARGSKIRVRFSGFINDAKNKRNIDKAEQGRLRHIPPDWWRVLCVHWDDPKVVAQSDRTRNFLI